MRYNLYIEKIKILNLNEYNKNKIDTVNKEESKGKRTNERRA